MEKKLLFLLVIFAITGCEIINPEEPIPAYIYVESFDLVTDPATEGSNSSNITDVWLFSDGDFLGVYPLPATIPILKSGMTNLRLRAGIKENGIAATPDYYPFYAPYDLAIDLREARVDTIRPVIEYLDETKFSFIESFDGGGHLFSEIRVGDIENKITLTTADVFEGTKSALIQLDTSHNIVELATGLSFDDLTETGKKVYLELNYKTEVPVLFGLIGFDNTNAAGEGLYGNGVNASSEWKKIYFNLTAAAVTDNFDFFKVGIRSSIPKEDGKFKLENAKIYLDNIKLLHF